MWKINITGYRGSKRIVAVVRRVEKPTRATEALGNICIGVHPVIDLPADLVCKQSEPYFEIDHKVKELVRESGHII